jgi:hypothetical protein
MSMHDHDDYARLAFKARAHGFVAKGEEPARFLHAVKIVLAGGNFPPDAGASPGCPPGASAESAREQVHALAMAEIKVCADARPGQLDARDRGGDQQEPEDGGALPGKHPPQARAHHRQPLDHFREPLAYRARPDAK